MSEAQSYNEAILQSIIDGTPYTDDNPYPSRIETLLLELKEVIENGGGGGDGYTKAQVDAMIKTITDQLFSTISGVSVNTETGSMELYSKDLDTITTSGFYNAMTCANAPVNYCTLIVTGYYLTGYCSQMATDVTSGKLYARSQINGTWGAWSQLETTAVT